MVDKNLFLYDLAIAAIMKNEGHYLKEWLDYHLLAGVDHFYIYDNDSTDNQAEVARPYVEAGLVDYIPASGKIMQIPAYNDAVKNFKFQCRYMAFIDVDEFIYPKTNRSLIEVIDEILSQDRNAAGLAINWQLFGSNGLEKADYSEGVLERFTRRAPSDWIVPLIYEDFPYGGNAHVKTIANPRAVNFFGNPHFACYLRGLYAVNENTAVVKRYSNCPITAEKIVVNHYFCKSREEFLLKQSRNRADNGEKHDDKIFHEYDRNEVFDDGILKYRDVRTENFSSETETEKILRVTKALTDFIASASAPGVSKNFFEHKLETALTCCGLSAYFREKFPSNANYWKIFEQKALQAILESLSSATSFTEAEMFLRDLPNLLKVPYPAEAEAIREAALNLLPTMIDLSRLSTLWDAYAQFDYLRDILKE